ncbi:MAG TPA: TlpA disulfide reductase family protein [Negativicutes bacterium]|jgi:thiol-disulfide isomerase/thioredoxin
MRKKFLMGAVVIIMMSIGLWYLGTPDKAELKVNSSETGIFVGKVSPAFTLEGLDGQVRSIGKAGRITVINFWATWCPPCREEMPELNKFAQNNKETVDFYAVNLQEPVEKVSDFMAKSNYTLPVLLDKDGEVGKKFKIKSIPTTIIVDKQGVIRYRNSGALTASELESILKGL